MSSRPYLIVKSPSTWHRRHTEDQRTSQQLRLILTKEELSLLDKPPVVSDYKHVLRQFILVIEVFEVDLIVEQLEEQGISLYLGRSSRPNAPHLIAHGV